MNKTQSTVDPKPSGFDDLINKKQYLDQDSNDVPVISQSLKLNRNRGANLSRKKSLKSQSFHQQTPFKGFTTKQNIGSNNLRNKSVNEQDSEADSPYYPQFAQSLPKENRYGSQVIKDQEIKVDEEDSAIIFASLNLHRSRKFTKSLIDQQSLGDDPVSPTGLQSRKNIRTGLKLQKKMASSPKRRGKSSNQISCDDNSNKYQKQFKMKKVSITIENPDDLMVAKNPSLTLSVKSPIPDSAQLKNLNGSVVPQLLPSQPQFNEIEQMKKMQQMHFESPKNECGNRAFRIFQVLGQQNQSQVAQKNSGSGDSNINPMESPDIVSTHLKQRAGQKTLTELNLKKTNFPSLPTTPDANLKLRDKNNIISEIANENSEESSQKPQLPIPNTVHKSVVLSTPLVFPNQTQRFIRMSSYSQNFGKKDLSSSVDRFNQTCSVQEHQEVLLLKKQLQGEKAKFDKQKAILEQQVELLTIQLHEASERDKNQKKKYQIMLKALENKHGASEAENPFKHQSGSRPSDLSEKRRISYDTSSPVRYQNSPQAKQKFDSNISQQWPIQQQEHIQKQQKELDDQNCKLMDQLAQLRQQIQTSDIQLKTQDRLLLQKEEDVVRIKREVKECQQTLRDHEELKQIEVQRCEQIKMEEMKLQINKLNFQSERQVAHVAEEYQEKTRRLNEQIIDYQKEIKSLNQELDNQLKLLHHKDSRLLSFEKHIQLHETNIDNLNRDIDRLISENHSKQAKIEKLTKDKERLLLEKLGKLKNAEGHQNQLSSPDSQLMMDTLDPLTQDMDGTNKFITSPNDSVIQMNNQQYDQQAEYSFGGDLERFSLFVANARDKSQSSQVRSDPKASQHNSPDGQQVIEKINFKLELSKINEEQAANSSKTDRLMLTKSNRSTSSLSVDVRKPIIKTQNNGKNMTSATKVPPAVKGLASRKNSLLKNSQSDRKVKIDLSASKRSPVRIEYWLKNSEDVFVDDGSYSPEMCDALRRRVAYLRSEYQKLNIKFKDLQFNSKKNIEKLNNEIQNQKRRRIGVQEDKLEQSHQYMQQITDQNKTIAHLQRDVTELVSENAKDDICNMNQTYFTGVPLMNKSLYASHSVYNLKGQMKEQQKVKRTGSINSRRGSVQSSFSQQSIGQQYKRNLSKTKKSSSKNSNKNDNQKIEKKQIVRLQTEALHPAQKFNKTQGGLKKQINMFMEESDNRTQEEDDDVYQSMQKIGGKNSQQSFALSDRNHVKKKVHNDQVVHDEEEQLQFTADRKDGQKTTPNKQRASVNDFKMSFLNSQYSQRESFPHIQANHVNPTASQEQMRTLKSLDAVNFSKYMTNRNQQAARTITLPNSDLGMSGILCGSTTNLMNCGKPGFDMINTQEVLIPGRQDAQQFSGDLAPIIMEMQNAQMTDRDINMLTQSLDQEAHPKYDLSDDQIRQSIKSLKQGKVPTQYNADNNLQMYYQKYKPYTQRVHSRSNGSKSKHNEESDDDCNLDDIGDENGSLENKGEEPIGSSRIISMPNLQTLPSPYEPPNTDRLGENAQSRILAAKTPLSCQSIFSTQRSKLAQSHMSQQMQPQSKLGNNLQVQKSQELGGSATQPNRRMVKNDSTNINAFSTHFQNALQVMTDTVQQNQISQSSMSDNKKYGLLGNSTSPRQKLQPPAYMKDRLLNSSTQMAMSNRSPQAMQRNNQQVNTLYHTIKTKNQVNIPRLQLSQTNSAGKNAISTNQMPNTFGNQFMNLQGRQTVQMSNVFRSTTSGTTLSMGPTLQNKKINH